MPRQQQKRANESSQPSERSLTLPSSAVKFTENSSAQGRLAFAEVIINRDTFPLFQGLKVCSFVVLKPKQPGGQRRVYVPGHKLPSGQSFQHLQEDTGDLGTLRAAIRDAYDAKFGAAEAHESGDKGFDDDQIPASDEDSPF